MRTLRSERDEDGDARRTTALMGFAFTLALAVLGVVLVRELGKQAKIEDCLMSGRTNCLPIELPLRTN